MSKLHLLGLPQFDDFHSNTHFFFLSINSISSNGVSSFMLIFFWNKSKRLIYFLSNPCSVERLFWKSIDTFRKFSVCEGFGCRLGIEFSMWTSVVGTCFVYLHNFRDAGFSLGFCSCHGGCLGLFLLRSGELFHYTASVSGNKISTDFSTGQFETSRSILFKLWLFDQIVLYQRNICSCTFTCF